jgi:glycosyltransferase involved in cell wall biosynthesis
MSTISVYTTTTNSIRDEFFAVEGIKSALKFADEVIIVDGGSEDNTLEQIEKIGDSRIKVFHSPWLTSLGTGIYAINKSLALGRCTSEWCVLMDSDEVFHEYDARKIQQIPSSVTDNVIAVSFNTLHFYKDYYHIMNGVKEWKDLYNHKIYMVRNGLGIHHGNNNGDPDAHLTSDGKPLPIDRVIHMDISVFHYGHVRTTESYLRKTNKLHKSFSGADHKEVTQHAWIPDWKLSTFSGEHPAVMLDRIAVGTNDYQEILSLYK